MIFNPSAGNKPLPELTSPATSAQVVSGYQAIDGNGNIINGSAQAVEYVTGTLKVASASQRIFFVSPSGPTSAFSTNAANYQCMKNSFLYAYLPNTSSRVSYTGGLEQKIGNLYYITGPFSLTVS